MQLVSTRVQFCKRFQVDAQSSKLNFLYHSDINTNRWYLSLFFYMKLKEYSLILTPSFLWHESEDTNKKSLFPKFQLIPILHFQVMHDYVYCIAPMITGLNKVSCTRLSVKIALISH